MPLLPTKKAEEPREFTCERCKEPLKKKLPDYYRSSHDSKVCCDCSAYRSSRHPPRSGRWSGKETEPNYHGVAQPAPQPQTDRDTEALAAWLGRGRQLKGLWIEEPKTMAVVARALWQATNEQRINYAKIARSLSGQWNDIDWRKVRGILQECRREWLWRGEPWLDELLTAQCKRKAAKQGIRQLQLIYGWLETGSQEIAAKGFGLDDRTAIAEAKRRFVKSLPDSERQRTNRFIKLQQRRRGACNSAQDSAGAGYHYEPKPREFVDKRTRALLRGYNRLTVNWCFGPGCDGDKGPGRLKHLYGLTPTSPEGPSLSEMCLRDIGFTIPKDKGTTAHAFLTVRQAVATNPLREPRGRDKQLAIQNGTCPVCGTTGTFTLDYGRCAKRTCRFRWGLRPEQKLESDEDFCP